MMSAGISKGRSGPTNGAKARKGRSRREGSFKDPRPSARETVMVWSAKSCATSDVNDELREVPVPSLFSRENCFVNPGIKFEITPDTAELEVRKLFRKLGKPGGNVRPTFAEACFSSLLSALSTGLAWEQAKYKVTTEQRSSRLIFFCSGLVFWRGLLGTTTANFTRPDTGRKSLLSLYDDRRSTAYQRQNTVVLTD
jgi:hypothetical protein